ncbi:MAG: hypothetical protein AB8B69_27215 [Chitinophagales bacterium]
MKFSKLSFLLLGLLFSTVTFTSCDDDDDTPTTPITLGSSVVVTNTFQSTAFTSGAEEAIEALFQAPAGSLAATANIGAAIEFPAYLLNLYNIDIDENSISFEVVAQADDPTYGDLFRVLESATFDRYYLTFNEAQNVNGFSSSNSSVNLRIDSDKVLVVEIGEDYDFKPGQSFTITLN